METVTDFIFLGSKITGDCDCSQEIKRHLLLGTKALTNLDSILKSRDISLPRKVHIVNNTYDFPSSHVQSFLGGSDGKASACSVGDQGSIPGSGRAQPTPVFLPGESNRQKSLVGYSPRGRKESDMTERLHFHFQTVKNLPAMQEKVKVKVKSLSCVRLFATPWTVVYQAPPSMGFSRQEYWSGLPFPSPGNLPNPGIKPGYPAFQADALTSEPPGKPVCIA